MFFFHFEKVSAVKPCLDADGELTPCVRQNRPERRQEMVPPWKKWLAKKGEQVEKVSGQQALSDEKSSSSRKAWRQWLEKQKSPHPPLPRLTTDSSTTATKTSADELGEKWESLTEPEYVFRPPGQLGLSRINVPLGPPMKTSAPVRVLKVPSEAAFAQATASTPYNFAGSMLNRAIPNALHELPKEHRDLPLRLIIFKLPSTGSTYFTELLQSIPQVHIAKELLTGADASKSTVWLTAQMTNALTHPMRGHNQGIESGVHIPQAVLGFTVCPIVLPNADFRAPIVQLKLPSSVFRVIALCRSNHVKHAVGLYRAAMLRAKCHSNNIRADTERKCTISNSQLDLSVSEFKQ